MASSWQKKAAHPVRADGRMCYLYKKTTEFVRGLVIYQAAFFAAFSVAFAEILLR